LKRGDIATAKSILKITNPEHFETELKAIVADDNVAYTTGRDHLFTRKNKFPVMLAVAFAFFNQVSGINAIIYYTAYIFKMGGAGVESALLQSVIIGLTLLLFTFAPLALIDHFGRRKLMIAGSIGYILSLGATAYAFYAHIEGKLLLISLLVFIGSHSVGQGSVIWVFISEIFPNRVRARGQALGCFTHWVMAAAISWSFPVVAARLGGHMIFAFYAVCMVGQLIWVWLIMPETKGSSLEQIQKQFGIE
jgi:MFS family permease